MSELQGTSGFNHLKGQGMSTITLFQLCFREGVATLVFNDDSNFGRFPCKTGKSDVTFCNLHYVMLKVMLRGKELISKTTISRNESQA